MEKLFVWFMAFMAENFPDATKAELNFHWRALKSDASACGAREAKRIFLAEFNQMEKV